jgi:hypothetical protein
MTNPLWLRVFADVGRDRYLSHAELPAESAARARAVWEVYDRLFGRFTGAGLDPLFHRFQHAALTIARPVLPRGVPLVIVGTGPSLEGGAEELRRVRARVLVASSPRGAVALQARGLHADLVLIEHQSVFDAQVSSEEQRHASHVRLHPDTLVLADRATPPELLPPDAAARVRLAESLPTWGLWPATLVALALESAVPAVGLLGIDLGGGGQLDPQHRPLASLLELLAYASGGTCRDCGMFGTHKPGWPRASLTAFAETATHPARRIEWRDERPASTLIEQAREDLRIIEPILPDARAALELGLQARAGNMPASDRDMNHAVEEMLAWGSDPHLRWILQRALGLTFLPRFWRSGVRMISTPRLWRPLVLALHELTTQADRFARAVGDADARAADDGPSDARAPTGASADHAAASDEANGSTGSTSATSNGGRGGGTSVTESIAAERVRRGVEAEPPRATRISVLLPVKNGLPFLHDAIASLVAQTHPDVEILVIDDGSTDGGPQEVIAQALSHVRVIKSSGQGLAAALNAGLRAATGVFVARQDADDWSHPERLARQFEYLSQHPGIDVLATCAEFVDREGRPVETSWTMSVRREQDASQTPDALADLLPRRAAIVHGSIMARRDVLREAGGYRSQAVYAEDYDLWLRLLPRTRFAKLPTRLYTYRLHDVTVSQQYRDIQLRSSIRAKLEYLQRRFPHLTTGTRLLLAGDPRDTGPWREIAADLKLTITAQTLPASPEPLTDPALAAALADTDILAILDLDLLENWIARLPDAEATALPLPAASDAARADTAAGHAAALTFAREGNFFVRWPRG